MEENPSFLIHYLHLFPHVLMFLTIPIYDLIYKYKEKKKIALKERKIIIGNNHCNPCHCHYSTYLCRYVYQYIIRVSTAKLNGSN